MANLSQEKRQRMLAFLDTIRQEHKDDDDVLIALGEIESELNAKKYGLVWEQHEEAVDVMMRTHIPVFTEDAGKEITTSAGGVEDFIVKSRLHQFYHHTDNMTGGTELTVFTCGGNLAEQIFVNITHDILVVHIHCINAVNDFCKDFGSGDKEDGIFHIPAESSVLALSDLLDKRENIGLNIGEHRTRFKVMEDIPTQISVFCFNMRIFADNTNAVSENLLL